MTNADEIMGLLDGYRPVWEEKVHSLRVTPWGVILEEEEGRLVHLNTVREARIWLGLPGAEEWA